MKTTKQPLIVEIFEWISFFIKAGTIIGLLYFFTIGIYRAMSVAEKHKYSNQINANK